MLCAVAMVLGQGGATRGLHELEVVDDRRGITIRSKSIVEQINHGRFGFVSTVGQDRVAASTELLPPGTRLALADLQAREVLGATVGACSVCCNASVAAYGPDSDLGVLGRLELSNSVHSMYSDSLYSSLLRERGRIGDHHSTVRVRVCRFDRALCLSAPGSASVHRVSPWAPRSNRGPPSRSRCMAAAEHRRGVLMLAL